MSCHYGNGIARLEGTLREHLGIGAITLGDTAVEGRLKDANERGVKHS